MDIESYIKDLSPELQEKAHACGSVEELLALAKEAKIPVPDEALVAVAGGDDVDVGSCGPDCCPKCGHREKPYWSEWLDNGELINAAFEYVIKERELPKPRVRQEDALQPHKISPEQLAKPPRSWKA